MNTPDQSHEKHPFGLPDTPNLEWLKTFKAPTQHELDHPDTAADRKARLLKRINAVINEPEFEATLEKEGGWDLFEFQTQWARYDSFEEWPKPFQKALLVAEAAQFNRAVGVTRDAANDNVPIGMGVPVVGVPSGERHWGTLSEESRLILRFSSLWLAYMDLRRTASSVLATRRESTSAQSLVLTHTLDELDKACQRKVNDLEGNLS